MTTEQQLLESWRQLPSERQQEITDYVQFLAGRLSPVSEPPESDSANEELLQELPIAAAVKWYEVGKVSQAKAAEIAGLSRQAFLEALDRFGVSPFQVSPEELESDLSNPQLSGPLTRFIGAAKGSRSFASAEEVDRFIRQERDAWES